MSVGNSVKEDKLEVYIGPKNDSGNSRVVEVINGVSGMTIYMGPIAIPDIRKLRKTMRVKTQTVTFGLLSMKELLI